MPFNAVIGSGGVIDAAFAMACDIGIVSSLSEVAVDDADSDGGATRISLPDLRPSNTTARSRPPAPARSTWYAAFEAISITTRVGRPAATTVEMKLNYLRPVLGGTITARARLLRMGSTLCVGRVDLFNDAKEMVAAALVTYMLIK